MWLNRVLIILVILFVTSTVQAKDPEKWLEYKSEHFVVYYKDQGAPEDFVRNVNEEAERYYHDITDNLGLTRYNGWMWDDRAKIYIYRDMEDYATNAGQYAWSHGAALVRTKTIRTFPSAHGFFDSTLPHEMGHIVFREFIGLDTQVPLWLDEGVAMFGEMAKRWGANKIIQDAIAKGTFIPLDQLSVMQLTNDTSQETIDLFYAESASVVYYLIVELGKYRFVDFCRKLKDGQTFEQALHGAYLRFRNIKDLNEAWKGYLQ